MVTKMIDKAGEQARVVHRAGYQDEVVVKARPKMTAVTTEELGARQVAGQQVEVPADIQAKAQAWMDSYKAFLTDQTELYLERFAAAQTNRRRGLGPEEGEPTVGDYVGWDLLTISPIQFETLPPYRPNKIIASGELTLLLAVMFINPAVSVADGFAIPANIQLGDRDFRLSFDQLNLTNATAGPNFTIVGNFGPAPVPPFILFPIFFIAPPVVSPELVEVNVTADILNLGQPYAAFATWHFDVDAAPSFLGLPPVPPQLEYDIPQRYMIYPK